MVVTCIDLVYGFVIDQDTLLKYFNWKCDCEEDEDHDTDECTEEKIYEQCSGAVLGDIHLYRVPHDDAKRYMKKTLDKAAAKAHAEGKSHLYILGVPIVSINTERRGGALNIEIDETQVEAAKTSFVKSLEGHKIAKVCQNRGMKIVKNDCGCCS